jgi:hypothetical protein
VPESPTVAAIGSVAAAALAASGGATQLFAVMGGGAYLAAGDVTLWAGSAGAPLHGRAVLLEGALPSAWHAVRLAFDGIAPWRPDFPGSVAGGAGMLGGRAAALAGWLARTEQPRGLATLLAGTEPHFPLHGARPLCCAFIARACSPDNGGAAEAALPLLGLGPGLTPSGDDFVAGALLALRLLEMADPVRARTVDALGASLRRAAERRTNRISAVLLGDASRGQSFAPMHALLAALAAGEEGAQRDAARSLVALGHSSGWDLLAGLCAGLGAAL